MRVFLAIDIPGDIREELVRLQDNLSVGRPVLPENLHLTLSFLGEQVDDALEAAHDALVSLRFPAFELYLASVGTFGKRSATAVFAGVESSEALEVLESRVTRSLRNAGLEFQKQRFRPHVTIARFSKPLSSLETARLRDFLADHATFSTATFKVEQFSLYRSIMRPRGAQYNALATYRLIDT